MTNAKFYGPEDPAPAVLPPFLVIVHGGDTVPTGAWAYNTADEAKECARQLRANGVSVKILAGAQ